MRQPMKKNLTLMALLMAFLALAWGALPVQAASQRPSRSASAQALAPWEVQLTGVIGQYNRNLTAEQRLWLARSIAQLSTTYQVDYRLIASVIAVESSFRPDAVSSTGAMGLGQLKDHTARWLHVANPFDPIDNMTGSVRYLRYLLDRFNGDMARAVSGYYIGPNAVAREGINPSALRYLTKVNTAFLRFSQPLG